MNAVISVLASDASAAASLYGTFDASNRSFLERQLRALQGNVVIDCTKAASLDDGAIALLHDFRERARRERRQVVIRVDGDLRLAHSI
jgi:anti-anti-sigma regulatory factor